LRKHHADAHLYAPSFALSLLWLLLR
jgi:hypothetical protein